MKPSQVPAINILAKFVNTVLVRNQTLTSIYRHGNINWQRLAIKNRQIQPRNIAAYVERIIKIILDYGAIKRNARRI